MSLTDIIKEIIKKNYQKYKVYVNYNISLILSDAVAPFGAIGSAYVSHKFGAGEYISGIVGGIAGNYVSAVTTFGAAWYLFNRKKYSGQFREYLKNYGEIIYKNLPPAAISYLIYMPIAYAAIFLGAGSANSAGIASVGCEAIFLLGSNWINQNILRKL